MKYMDYSKNDLNIDKFKEYVQANIEKNEDNTVKNYKVMCELIGECETTGNSKKAQLNRWKRYFDFYKDGQKFLINEIYDEPFATDDARKRKEGLYVKYIELLLLEYLSKQTDYKVTVGSKEMYRILGMTNENYSIRSKMKSIAANEVIRQTMAKNESRFVFTNPPVISDFNINNFYFRAEQKLNKILYSALNSMKNRFLIDYKKVNIIGELKIIEENGCNYLDYRESTAYEDKLILESKKLIINQMGYNNVTEIMLCYKCEEFYNKFNEYIKEHYGWERCYPQLRVVYIDDIARQIPIKAEEIRKFSYEDKQSQLNTEIIKSLNIQAEKRYDDNCKKIETECNSEWGDLNKMDDTPFVYESDYVEIQRALANYLLNIHFKSTI